MIVLDATVLIAYLTNADPHHDKAVAVLADNAGGQFVTSAMTVAETLVRPVNKGTVNRAIEILTSELDITTVAIRGTESLRLAEIRARTGLKLPDCCVLLAAEKISAPMIATFDNRLADAAIEHGLLVLPARR